MIFSSLSKREKTILFLILIIIAAGFIYNFVLEPVVSKWKDLDVQIRAKKIKLEKYVRLISRTQEYSKEYNRYSPHLEGVKSDEEQFAVVLSFVESVSRKTNVYINSLKPNSVKKEKLYKKFLVEAEIEAPIRDLVRFLYEIENSSMMLKVNGIDINARSGETDGVKARVLISNILF